MISDTLCQAITDIETQYRRMPWIYRQDARKIAWCLRVMRRLLRRLDAPPMSTPTPERRDELQRD